MHYGASRVCLCINAVFMCFFPGSFAGEAGFKIDLRNRKWVMGGLILCVRGLRSGFLWRVFFYLFVCGVYKGFVIRVMHFNC